MLFILQCCQWYLTILFNDSYIYNLYYMTFMAIWLKVFESWLVNQHIDKKIILKCKKPTIQMYKRYHFNYIVILREKACSYILLIQVNYKTSKWPWNNECSLSHHTNKSVFIISSHGLSNCFLIHVQSKVPIKHNHLILKLNFTFNFSYIFHSCIRYQRSCCYTFQTV